MTKRPTKPQDRPSLPRFKKKVRGTAAQTSAARISYIEEIEGVENSPVPPTPPASASASPIADFMTDTIPSIYPQFYGALGRAIAAWQHVETVMCDVFAKVSTCREVKVAAAMYYGHHDFFEKLELTHNAARLSLANSSLYNEWIDLRKELIDAAERRNALAHFHTTLLVPLGLRIPYVLREISHAGELIGEEPKGAEAKGIRLMLQPNSGDPNEKFKTNQKKSKAPMNLQDIMKTRRLFGTLHEMVKAFSEKIQQPEAPQK